MNSSILPILDVQDFRYELPDDRIARYPLPERDAARLLVWRAGRIEHRIFRALPELLDGTETLFFNNTKVIPARLFFQKDSGGIIEVFLLRPETPAVVDLAMRATGPTLWLCAIGNLRRWPEDITLERELIIDNQTIVLHATLLDRAGMRVQLHWDDPQLPFVKIVEAAGQVPIPPYLNRASEETDKSSYQTVYGKRDGAVAAPTAGLHFTPVLLERLRQKSLRTEELTLHVSAGTFKPVKTANALEHDMHAEQLVLRRSNVEALLDGRKIVAVGTTSLRTLESLYWFGVKLLQNPDAAFRIGKLEPYAYENDGLPALKEAVQAVMRRFERDQADELYGDTQIYIVPGYQFRVCDALITNFHQPASTLMLLVAAFTGGNHWRDIYCAAMDGGYRFLSYGDSSLLFRDQETS